MTPRPWNLGSRDGVRRGQTLRWPHNRRGTRERHLQGFCHPGILMGMGTGGGDPALGTLEWPGGTIKGLRLGPRRDWDHGGTEDS